MNAVSNIMGKLNGAELGKLFLNDSIGIFQGKGSTYSTDDFQIAINKLDRSDRYKFSNYRAFCESLFIHWLLYRGAVDNIHKQIMTLSGFEFFLNSIDILEGIRQQLTLERIGRDEIEPGGTETFLLELINDYKESLIDVKGGISQIYTAIAEWLKNYFTLVDILKGISKRLELPELGAVISDDTLSKVAELNTWAAGLPEEYRDIFQAIDIDELAEVRLIDTERRINLMMRFIEG